MGDMQTSKRTSMPATGAAFREKKIVFMRVLFNIRLVAIYLCFQMQFFLGSLTSFNDSLIRDLFVDRNADNVKAFIPFAT